LIALGGLAAIMILAWDWRVSVPALILIQAGVGQMIVNLYGVPQTWALLYLLVLLLSCAMLSLSVLQIRTKTPAPRLTNWFFRLTLLTLLVIGLAFLDVRVTIPNMSETDSQLFVWLALCAILILAITDNPLDSAFGLLLWFIPVQAVAAVLLPVPPLVAVLGSLQLIVGLACSYLILIDVSARIVRQRPITDVTFPTQGLPGPTIQEAPAWTGLATRFSSLILAFKKRV
jgi:hypothetical protein